MDLFGHVTPRSINHEKYTIVIVDEYSRVFNTRRQQTKEIDHITFDKSPDAIKFTKPLVDNINIAEFERYSPDEYLHPYEPSQRYQTNSSAVSFTEPYESLKLVVLGTEFSSDQNGQTNQNDLNDQNDQSAQTDEILNDDQSEHSNRDKHIELVNIIDFLSKEEPKKVSEALQHPGWVDAIQEELNQFSRNKV
ncbi:hypothetical protein Tco_0857121 [Tanacetum coccineum]|uniref:Uncharacterized protein n=1 Tax=Tanacetum coccineum TaxID=301880 RepID=A0ABQ5B9L5_9ASTR